MDDKITSNEATTEVVNDVIPPKESPTKIKIVQTIESGVKNAEVQTKKELKETPAPTLINANSKKNNTKTPDKTKNKNNRKRKGYNTYDASDGTNLIVNYLPDSMNEVMLYDMFCEHGEIESVRVIRDHVTQQPRGYGFVKFKDSKSATKAIKNLNGLNIMHKQLKVAHSRPGGSRSNANLFVGSLPPEYDEKALEELFKDFYPIIDRRILRFSDGNSKQCGFVRLDSEEIAQKAISKLNGMQLKGYRIQVKLAKRLGDRLSSNTSRESETNQQLHVDIPGMSPEHNYYGMRSPENYYAPPMNNGNNYFQRVTSPPVSAIIQPVPHFNSPLQIPGFQTMLAPSLDQSPMMVAPGHQMMFASSPVLHPHQSPIGSPPLHISQSPMANPMNTLYAVVPQHMTASPHVHSSSDSPMVATIHNPQMTFSTHEPPPLDLNSTLGNLTLNNQFHIQNGGVKLPEVTAFTDQQKQ